MFRAHVNKVTAVLLLTLALGVVSVPAQAAGFSSERPSRWEQLVESLFGWLLKSTGMIDPNGKAGSPAPPAGAAALCLDTTGCIDPNGRQ